MTTIDELLGASGAELPRGTFDDAVVVPEKWMACPGGIWPMRADVRKRSPGPAGSACRLPGEQAETASDESVREVLDAVVAAVPDDELGALLDEPLHHEGGGRVIDTIT